MDKAIGTGEIPTHGVAAFVPPRGASIRRDVESVCDQAVIHSTHKIFRVVSDAGEFNDFRSRGVGVVLDEAVVVQRPRIILLTG